MDQIEFCFKLIPQTFDLSKTLRKRGYIAPVAFESILNSVMHDIDYATIRRHMKAGKLLITSVKYLTCENVFFGNS